MERRYAGGPHQAARTAVVWQVLRRELDRAVRTRERLSVVDVGGGTGGFAVPLAEAGHLITVIDASPDALAALARRAAEAGVADRVRAVQGDADSLADLVAPGSADVVLCHSVLEIVDSPANVAAALASTLRSGGAASVIVANRNAAVLARAMSGHLDTALALLRDPDGQTGARDDAKDAAHERREGTAERNRGAPRRRFDPQTATALLARAGLTVEEIHGVRVVADLVPGSVLDRDHEALTTFELATAAHSPFRDMAAQLHLLARRP